MWYYRAGCGCKKLHPPLPPLLLRNLAWCHGTIVPQHGTTAGSADVKNYIRAYHRLRAVPDQSSRYYRSEEQYYRGSLRYYRAGARYYRWLLR